MCSFDDFVFVLLLFIDVVYLIVFIWFDLPDLICWNSSQRVEKKFFAMQIICIFNLFFFLELAIPCVSHILKSFASFNEYFEPSCVLLDCFLVFYALLTYWTQPRIESFLPFSGTSKYRLNVIKSICFILEQVILGIISTYWLVLLCKTPFIHLMMCILV